MTIQRKLLAAFLALSAASLVAAVIGTNYAVRQAAKEKMEADLVEAVSEFQHQVESLENDLALAADASLTENEINRNFAASNDDQNEALGLGSGSEGLAHAHDVAKSADLKLLKSNDILVLVNARGRVFYTLADPEQLDQDLSEMPIIKSALGGGQVKDLWSTAVVRQAEVQSVRMLARPGGGREEHGLYVVYATPYRRAGQIYGAVLIGKRVRPSLLKELERTARARVVLRAQDEMAVSTLGDLAQLPREAWSGQPLPVSLDGVDYLALARTVERPGGGAMATALLLREVDADVKPIVAGFWQALPGVVLAALAISLALASVLSRRMARPMERLADAAKQVKLGDLAVEVPVESSDELGRLAASFNEMVAGLRQRDQIKGLFKRYLDPQVVEELIRHPEKASPGGERRDLTVLFSDLVGFTTISEKLGPEALVALLNDYFEAASHELAAHGATFDKFIGDAIMCFWNAPLPQEDHAARACRTAVGLLRVVEAFSTSPDGSNTGRLRCRIGINSGPCIVGNIGSKAAQDYTVVGDTVNLASRLEAGAKIYGTRSLVSETTIQAAGGVVVVRELDMLKVRGRGQPVRVYELLGLAGTPVRPEVQRFADGLGLYRARRFEEALKAFEASPNDPPSAVFAERCRQMVATRPPEDWAGVYEVHG
ncbi:MAG TPA: adenylate/guanylate cyclase domain-containing protein [Myxococcales bacterium]|nr:adenylate/guanylate cyclase domain-containing protein [Myxococcales bacterium]